MLFSSQQKPHRQTKGKFDLETVFCMYNSKETNFKETKTNEQLQWQNHIEDNNLGRLSECDLKGSLFSPFHFLYLFELIKFPAKCCKWQTENTHYGESQACWKYSETMWFDFDFWQTISNEFFGWNKNIFHKPKSHSIYVNVFIWKCFFHKHWCPLYKRINFVYESHEITGVKNRFVCFQKILSSSHHTRRDGIIGNNFFTNVTLRTQQHGGE